MTLTLQNVTKRFGTFTAVDDLSLTIPKGEVFGFLGANGSGKTTSFRIILGLLEPSEGYVTWDGQKIDYSTSNIIGYLPEERGLYPKLKVSEQVHYLASLRGMHKKDADYELKQWLEFFDVPQYYNQKVEELSKGNQQKIQFITAIVHKPQLIILDEPFSGLDPVNTDLLKKAIAMLKQAGSTIVFSSHQMSNVEEMCENLCIILKGKTVINGKLKDIKRSFGKKSVVIHADFNLDFLEQHPLVLKYHPTTEGAQLHIADEANASALQQELVQKGFVRRFALEEPSLHDIFLETVGEHFE